MHIPSLRPEEIFWTRLYEMPSLPCDSNVFLVSVSHSIIFIGGGTDDHVTKIFILNWKILVREGPPSFPYDFLSVLPYRYYYCFSFQKLFITLISKNITLRFGANKQ